MPSLLLPRGRAARGDRARARSVATMAAAAASRAVSDARFGTGTAWVPTMLTADDARAYRATR